MGIGLKKVSQSFNTGEFDIPYSNEGLELDINGNSLTNYQFLFTTILGNQIINIEILTTPRNDRFMEGDVMKFGGGVETSIRWTSFPLSLKYKLTGKKINLFLKPGFTFNLLNSYKNLNERIVITNLLYTINRERVFINKLDFNMEPNSLNNHVFDVFLAIELESKINKTIKAFSNFEYNYSLSPIFEDNDISTNFNSIGFSIGVRFLL